VGLVSGDKGHSEQVKGIKHVVMSPLWGIGNRFSICSHASLNSAGGPWTVVLHLPCKCVTSIF